jgi:hypothetical protein
MAATSTAAAAQLGSTLVSPSVRRRTPSKATAPDSRKRNAVSTRAARDSNLPCP